MTFESSVTILTGLKCMLISLLRLSIWIRKSLVVHVGTLKLNIVFRFPDLRPLVEAPFGVVVTTDDCDET